MGTGGGEERICVGHESVFEMEFFFLFFLLIISLDLGVHGGSVQLEFFLSLSGSCFFL